MLSQFKRLVVVTGCQRSGTTMTGQILGAHPNAILIDENDGLYPWFEAVSADRQDLEQIWSRTLDAASQKYLNPQNRFSTDDSPTAIKRHPDVTHLVLKGPNLLYEYKALSALKIPISVIYPVRDVRAVVASMARLDHIPMVENQATLIRRKSDIAEELAPELLQLSDPELPVYVKRSIVWRIKSHFQYRLEAYGLPVLSFRYEDLVADPNGLVPQLSYHCNLKHDDAMLNHAACYRGSGPGNTDRTRPIDRKSVPIWQEDLSRKQIRAIVSSSISTGKPSNFVGTSLASTPRKDAQFHQETIESPLIVIGRGGSGTRLLSKVIGEDVFFGNTLNQSEDSLEWIGLIYEMSILHRSGIRPKDGWSSLLVNRAREILAQSSKRPDQPWGWKLPETTIVIPEVAAAFPNAKIVQLVRHPIAMGLRKTHVTSRADNPVGRAILNAAYEECGRDPSLIATDESYRANALSWRYQVNRATRFCRDNLESDQYLEIRFEDLIASPKQTVGGLSEFLGVPLCWEAMEIDVIRATLSPDAEQHDKENWIWDMCAPVAKLFGYER